MVDQILTKFFVLRRGIKCGQYCFYRYRYLDPFKNIYGLILKLDYTERALST